MATSTEAVSLTLRARLLVRLSSLFPAPDLSRYEGAESYAGWQHAAVRKSWNSLLRGNIDLRDLRVVDLGCGEGGKTAFYASLGPRLVVGLDCLEQKVSAAGRLAQSRGRSGCRFYVARAEATALQSGGFDVAISDDAFEHYPAPEAVLQEAHRILKDGGLFVILFTTYWTPAGPHLYNFIRLPYAHLFFGDETMKRAVRYIAAEMESRNLGRDRAESPTAQAERELDQMHHFINKMSLRRFKSLLVRQSGWQLVHYHRYVGSHRGLPFVLWRNMPGIEELGGRLLFVLRKTADARIRHRDFRSRRTRIARPRVLGDTDGTAESC